jgi:tetratricopeptide (TPR) repeat protein
MSDNDIGRDVNAENSNIGGTQNFYGNVYFGGRPVEAAPPPNNRIFLSYAWNDDPGDYLDANKSFMRKLYNDLTAEGYDVWWDREKMPSRGQTFNREIQDAIATSYRLILVVGQHAVESNVVHMEWNYALSLCIPIVAILREKDFTLIPEVIRNINAPDFRDEKQYPDSLKVLKRVLKDDDSRLATLFGVPPLPGSYIEREALSGIRDNLMIDTLKPMIVAAKEQVEGLTGMGGIGKTTLASALSRDCGIRRAFPDGIFWIEIGKTPDLISRMADIGVIFGDSRDNYRELTQAKQSLIRMLANKRALLILDDVWDHQHAQVFQVTSVNCRLLITTRQNRVLINLDAQGERLETLSEDEGLRLIAERLSDREQRVTPDTLPPECSWIVQILGGHTLAISIAAARLKERGVSYAPHLLARLTNSTLLNTLQLQPDDKNLSVEKSIGLSYEDLTDDLKRRFRAVGIFALTGTFDEAMVIAVWGDNEPDDADTALNELVRAGLLQRAADSRYSQHGLLRAYARALLDTVAETEDTFGRYADFVIEQSEQFDKLPLEQWGQLDPLLPHVQEVGDELVRQWQAVDAANADEIMLKRCGEFAVKVRNYVLERPQMIHIEGKSELRGLRWLEMGLAVYQQLGNQRRESLLLNDLALAWDNLGEKRKALDFYEQALPLYRAVGDRSGEAVTLNNIGMAWDALGEKRKALDYLEQALSLRRAVGDRSGEATTLNNIGGTWDALGEKRKALDYYEQGLKIIQEIGGKRNEAGTLNNIGSVWDALGEKRKALDYYEQALPLSRSVGDRSGEAVTLNNIGAAWDALGEKRQALDYYEQALPLRRAVGDRSGEAVTCVNMGIVYESLGDLDRAIAYVERCVQLETEIEDPYLENDRQYLEQLKRKRDGA